MSEPDKILIIRLKSIGDILFTLPAVHVLRENFPDARISFLVSKEYAALLEGFREVDEVIPFDRGAFRGANFARMIGETCALVRRLRRDRFSLAVDLQGYGETALFTWLTRAPDRWGMVYQSARKWAYTRGISRDWNVHPAGWNLWMLEQCGLKSAVRVRNEFILPPAALDEARRIISETGLRADKATLFIQPFTSSLQKDWPLEKYLELARHWRGRGVQVVFGGGPSEKAALDPARAEKFPVTAGAPLLVTAGLIQLSTLVVGSDTGLLHLSVALGRRVVMIMQTKSVHATHPFQHRDWAITPRESETVAQLETQTVIKAAAQAFAELQHR